MGEQRSALIVYDGLPVSSGGAHHLGNRGPADVWARLSAFLRECTEAVEPYQTTAHVYEAFGECRASTEAAKVSASALFGAPRRRAVVAGVTEIHENAWTLQPGQLPDALRWLTEQRPERSLPTGPPFLVGLEARFRLKDPESVQVLPYQGPEHYGHQKLGHRLPLGLSMLYARLAAQSTCALTLCLPFAEVSPELLRYVAALEQELQFRLSVRHWTRWQLNAAGSGYYSRKIRVRPASRARRTADRE